MDNQLNLFNKVDFMFPEKCCSCNKELTEDDGIVPATDSVTCILCKECQKKYKVEDEKRNRPSVRETKRKN